jgi:hypothetical protein
MGIRIGVTTRTEKIFAKISVRIKGSGALLRVFRLGTKTDGFYHRSLYPPGGGPKLKKLF